MVLNLTSVELTKMAASIKAQCCVCHVLLGREYYTKYKCVKLENNDYNTVLLEVCCNLNNKYICGKCDNNVKKICNIRVEINIMRKQLTVLESKHTDILKTLQPVINTPINTPMKCNKRLIFPMPSEPKRRDLKITPKKLSTLGYAASGCQTEVCWRNFK